MSRETLEFRKLCLDIQMRELMDYLNDPNTKMYLALAKLTHPEAYYQVMNRVDEVLEDYRIVTEEMEQLELV